MAQSVADKDTPQRSAKWHRRRELIIDRSATLIALRGYHATGTSELCELNELGKGALYYYIGSKEQLLAAIHDRVMDEVLAGARRVVQRGGSPAEVLARLGQSLIDVIARYPHHVTVFLHDFPALTGENARRFRTRRHKYEQYVEDVLAAGVECGDFRPLDPPVAARAWLGMHNYTYLWLKSGGSLTPGEVAAAFADIFIDGISKGTRDIRGAVGESALSA